MQLRLNHHFVLLAVVWIALCVAPKAGLAVQADKTNDTAAQESSPEIGLTFSKPIEFRWRVGVRIVGGSKSAKNMLVTIPVPVDWPEQKVTVADEDIPSTIDNIEFRELNGGVKQLIFLMPVVNARQETKVSMTFLVKTSQINPPVDPSVFVKPKSSKREAKSFLGISPHINFRNSKLRKQVKELTKDKQSVWEEVESIFNWVDENVLLLEGKPQNIVKVFEAKEGCPEDRVGLFVGMCRTHKIPARIVWVEGTMYPEFMLADKDGNPHWFPCNINGIREFGSMSDPRIILQKGDSVRVPEKEERQKFVAEFATCSGEAKPAVRFTRELLSSDN